jgi:hypothetical protein
MNTGVLATHALVSHAADLIPNPSNAVLLITWNQQPFARAEVYRQTILWFSLDEFD